VYGTTEHPFKAGRIPGGSSGGEAALLASFGSSFGTGSDLAGSLRIPASMCGVIALKPTEARIHLRHSYGGIPGRGRMGLGIGFFSHDVDTQIFLLNHAWNSEYFHKTAPKSVPIPFRMNMVEDTLKVKSLRIGYFAEDGFLKATPGCERVVYETVTKLEAMGHHLIRFDLPRAFEAAGLFLFLQLYVCSFRNVLQVDHVGWWNVLV
jgi:Asp-tRNA(Asn)/Glu-tRNA(Gln) amidotransferase A subunit family amidase